MCFINVLLHKSWRQTRKNKYITVSLAPVSRRQSIPYMKLILVFNGNYRRHTSGMFPAGHDDVRTIRENYLRFKEQM